MKKMFLLPLAFLIVILGSCKKDETPSTDPNNQALPAGWEILASPSLVRNNHSAVVLSDGRVLITGGEVPVQELTTKNCEIYDPLTDTWTDAAPMNEYRMMHSSILLNNGRVLVMGGYNAKSGQYLKNGEVYDPLSNTWTLTPSVVYETVNSSMVLDTSGKVVFVTHQSIESYDPATNTITGIIDNTDDAYYEGTTLQVLKSGIILAIGGGGAGIGNQHSECRLINVSGTFNMNEQRAYGSSILLPDGKVLLFGGQPGTNIADVFDPLSEKWTLTGQTTASPEGLRLFHGKTDKVIAFGDYSLKEFTISNGKWTQLSSPPSIYWGGVNGNIAAVQLTNGKLFITGGYNLNTRTMEQKAYLFTP